MVMPMTPAVPGTVNASTRRGWLTLVLGQTSGHSCSLMITGRGGLVPRHQVLLFLELMKTTARRQFVFVGREKNLTTLANLGINRMHAE